MSLGPAPEDAAARALRDWLLWQLPAACVLVNAQRAAFLRAPQPGPYTIPSNAALKVSITDKAGTTSSIALTSGSRTTAQLVTEINASVSNLASADANDHLVLTSTTAPSYVASGGDLTLTDSVVAIGADTTGANAALGFETGGQYSLRTAVTPPGPLGVLDGYPVGDVFEPIASGKGRVLVTIGARKSQPVDRNPRRGEWNVELMVEIFRVDPKQAVHQTKDSIQAAVHAVRTCLFTDTGKQLGRARNGDIVLALEQGVDIAPFSFQRKDSSGQKVGPLFDAATLKLGLRVFQLVQPT
jgi:hypothetical protein